MGKASVLTEYDFSLPKELLASRPAEPRDSSRLFVYDSARGKIFLDVFSNLYLHLPRPALLVFNRTKVVPARINLTKETGGRVECLFLVNELKPEDNIVKVLADRKIAVGQKLAAGSKIFSVVDQAANIFYLKPEFDIGELNTLLEESGRTPIPKYLGNSELQESELRRRYQSILAEKPASVAAPTASLHFTPAVLESIRSCGLETADVTLHVGLGTFAPITEENVRNKRLHMERYHIEAADQRKILEAKNKGVPVIAVGTTTARALESAAAEIFEGKSTISGETEIFIAPPYRFKVVDALITNFHLPKSSLMCMVDAFLKQKNSKHNLISLYERAIKEKYRFYSFGDCMLIK